jgi:hypothetical protein
MASATSSVIPGKAISRSRPKLELVDPEPLPVLLPPTDDNAPRGLDAPVVGMMELEAADISEVIGLKVESIKGSTLRFSRADSFCIPKRTLAYSPDSFSPGAINV